MLGVLTKKLRRLEGGVMSAMRPYRGYLLALVPVSLVTGTFEAATLVLVTDLAMSISGASSSEPLSIGPVALPTVSSRTTLLWASGALAGATLFGMLTVVLGSRLSARVLDDRRVSLLAAYLGASWTQQGRLREGELHELMSSNCDRAAQAARALTGLLVSASNLAIMVLGAIAVFPMGALVIIGAVLGLAAAMRPLNRRTYRHGMAQVEGARHLAQVVSETVRMRGDVRTYGVEKGVFAEMTGRLRRVTDAYRRSKMLQTSIPVFYRSGLIAFVLAGLGLAAFLYGEQSAARLGILVVLLLRALSYGQSLQSALGMLSDQVPFIKRLDEVEASLAPKEKSSPAKRYEGSRAVEFDRVTLSIDGKAIIVGVSIELRRGELIAVTGPSGAGKSTLANVMSGVLEPNEGRVLLGGTDRKHFDEKTWRSRIAYVAQHSELIEGTIADNVRFYREELREETVQDSLLQARLIQEPYAFTDWALREVSPTSNSLSGGQAQRVSIARAIAGNPDYLILDEPSAALDQDSEQLLADSLVRLRDRGLGVLVIAHRPALIAIADRVVVMKNGRIVASGPPAQTVKEPFHAGNG